jgi:hypothetical protein
MLKRYSIIFLLLFAYTIVLGHSIIPHHHHDYGHATEQSSHHHDDHEDDHHNDDAESLAHDFENYLHAGDAGDYHQQTDVQASRNTIATVYLISFFEFKVNAIESPPPVVRLSNEGLSIVRHSLSSKGLRAPPCLIA